MIAVCASRYTCSVGFVYFGFWLLQTRSGVALTAAGKYRIWSQIRSTHRGRYLTGDQSRPSFCSTYPIERRLRFSRVAPEDSQEAAAATAGEEDEGDTSGVRLLLASPDAADAKDRELWCTPEEVLAMLLAGVKVGGYVPG